MMRVACCHRHREAHPAREPASLLWTCPPASLLWTCPPANLLWTCPRTSLPTVDLPASLPAVDLPASLPTVDLRIQIELPQRFARRDSRTVASGSDLCQLGEDLTLILLSNGELEVELLVKGRIPQRVVLVYQRTHL